MMLGMIKKYSARIASHPKPNLDAPTIAGPHPNLTISNRRVRAFLVLAHNEHAFGVQS